MFAQDKIIRNLAILRIIKIINYIYRYIILIYKYRNIRIIHIIIHIKLADCKCKFMYVCVKK